MSKAPAYIDNFPKKEKHTNVQKMHDKVLNIITANQNHNEILTHTCQDVYYQEDTR